MVSVVYIARRKAKTSPIVCFVESDSATKIVAKLDKYFPLKLLMKSLGAVHK